MIPVLFKNLKLNNFYFVCYKPYKQMKLLFVSSINDFVIVLQDIISKQEIILGRQTRTEFYEI